MSSPPGPADVVHTIYIGTAGWTVPRESRAQFPEQGSHLQRYAARLNAVEINSSFYKPHRATTYARWAATVPEGFRFSVKLPREITHKKRFVDVSVDLERFVSEATSLGSKLGPILIQLPPSFAFDAPLADEFFRLLRGHFAGMLAFEPRHATWFETEAEQLLQRFEVARVAADPAVVAAAAAPGGWTGFRYFRLHGSPRIYYSPYPPEYLQDLAETLRSGVRETWCIFDNTALGYATGDALVARGLLSR